MLDIRLLRENFSAFESGLARRGLGAVAAELQALDTEARAAQTELQKALAEGPRDEFCVYRRYDCEPQCGRCVPEIRAMLEQAREPEAA